MYKLSRIVIHRGNDLPTWLEGQVPKRKRGREELGRMLLDIMIGIFFFFFFFFFLIRMGSPCDPCYQGPVPLYRAVSTLYPAGGRH